MIDKDNIESKDFSMAFPEIISKLPFISYVTKYNSDEQIDYSVDNDFTHGLGFIIQDAVDDLRQIYNALYPETKIFCPEE